jgi:hypothetical protein
MIGTDANTVVVRWSRQTWCMQLLSFARTSRGRRFVRGPAHRNFAMPPLP